MAYARDSKPGGQRGRSTCTTTSDRQGRCPARSWVSGPRWPSMGRRSALCRNPITTRSICGLATGRGLAARGPTAGGAADGRSDPGRVRGCQTASVLDDAIGALLPAAVAVALSPVPIAAIVLVLAGSHARTAGPAFAVGWIAGLSAVSAVVVTIAHGASDPDSAEATGISWLKLVLGLAFWVMAARQWRHRPKRGEAPEMPGWMASIDDVSVGRAAVLGVGLSAANPKNLALTMAASASIAQAGLGSTDTAVAVAVFVAVGSASVAGAVLFALVAPGPAERSLAAVREFMTDNNATIMMVIFVILGAKLLGDALPGL